MPLHTTESTLCLVFLAYGFPSLLAVAQHLCSVNQLVTLQRLSFRAPLVWLQLPSKCPHCYPRAGFGASPQSLLSGKSLCSINVTFSYFYTKWLGLEGFKVINFYLEITYYSTYNSTTIHHPFKEKRQNKAQHSNLWQLNIALLDSECRMLSFIFFLPFID